MLAGKYLDYIKEYEGALKAYAGKNVLYGFIRLFVLAAAAALLVLLIVFWFSLAFLLPLCVSLAAFVVLTVLHARVTKNINYLKGMIRICREYLSRIDGGWTEFPHRGAEFSDYGHDYTFDLDIFGDKSLFQLINVTKSFFGKTRLKDDLSRPEYTAEQILRRQEAVRELSEADKFCHAVQYYGEPVAGDESVANNIQYVKDKGVFLKSEVLRQILFFLPFLAAPFCLVVFIAGIKALYVTAYILMSLQILLWLGLSAKTHGYLSNSESLQYSLSGYSRIYKAIEGQPFESGLLCEIKSELAGPDFSAAAATKKLSGILQRVQMRKNGILYFFLNALLLWDISCAVSLSAWAAKYGRFLEGWFLRLGELESLASLAAAGNVIENTCMPAVSHAPHIYAARNIGHPLLPNGKRVCNDFRLCHKINIISGSNMSGKTTFLRTLGVNLVLAKNGGFVCASEMVFSNMGLVSSMRITDDLGGGVSTFYAELKKVKRVLDACGADNNTLFLIDELFRGTNSCDRAAGVAAVLKKLDACGAYGLLTTHDLSLCGNKDGLDAENYNFSEHYENGTLRFSYKIGGGAAKTTNGEYLMKLLGIMDDPE